MSTIRPVDVGMPITIARYLLPWERAVVTIRLHPAILSFPVLTVLAGLLAAIALGFEHIGATPLLIIWLVWLGLLFRMLFKIFGWLEDYYVVTNARMLIISGTSTRDVAMIPLAQLGDLRFRRTAMGRILGYGQFIIQPVGQGRPLWVINYLPYPEQLYLELCGLLFSSLDTDDGEP
jgi:hypothetical protein